MDDDGQPGRWSTGNPRQRLWVGGVTALCVFAAVGFLLAGDPVSALWLGVVALFGCARLLIGPGMVLARRIRPRPAAIPAPVSRQAK